MLIGLFERAMREQVFALVSFPPRHAKSTTVRRALAYAIGRYPDRLNGLVMYAGDAAEAQSRRIRNMVTRDGVALARDAQRLDLWITQQEGGLAATGITGQLTGKGFGGVLVIDDPTKGREAAESPSLREKAWTTFTDDAFSRLEPPCGSCIIVATRWHHDDIPGRIIERMGRDGFPAFEVINLPAIRDPHTNEPADDGVALWPERFPLEKLHPIRATLGPYGWASLYQGHPVPRGGTLFKVPARYEKPEIDGARVVIGIDPAGTASERADYTAAVVLAAYHARDDATGEVLRAADVLEVERGQWETAGAAAKLEALQSKYPGAPLVIEASRDGHSIRRALEAINRRLRITTVPPLGDKFTRAQPVVAAWNNGRVRLPLRAEWLEAFVHETELFTGVGDRHDDQVDALAYAWSAADIEAESYDAIPAHLTR